MNNLVARQSLNTDQQLMVNAEFEKKKKSKGIAYLLWFLLGSLGGHRFYVGDIGLAIGLIVVWIIGWFTLFIPTLIWLLVDVFLLSGRVDKKNDELEASIIAQVKTISA
ncbi:MAG: TM2 domain-containing protein [Clostridia bacterium]